MTIVRAYRELYVRIAIRALRQGFWVFAYTRSAARARGVPLASPFAAAIRTCTMHSALLTADQDTEYVINALHARAAGRDATQHCWYGSRA